jgi:hypothetical protein
VAVALMPNALWELIEPLLPTPFDRVDGTLAHPQPSRLLSVLVMLTALHTYYAIICNAYPTDLA